MSDLTVNQIRRTLLWIVERLLIDPQEERCERCGHSGYYHRLDDALDVSPDDPSAEFRCVFPLPAEGHPPVRLCECHDFVGNQRVAEDDPAK